MCSLTSSAACGISRSVNKTTFYNNKNEIDTIVSTFVFYCVVVVLTDLNIPQTKQIHNGMYTIEAKLSAAFLHLSWHNVHFHLFFFF
jgi:hypothetical protein